MLNRRTEAEKTQEEMRKEFEAQLIEGKLKLRKISVDPDPNDDSVLEDLVPENDDGQVPSKPEVPNEPRDSKTQILRWVFQHTSHYGLNKSDLTLLELIYTSTPVSGRRTPKPEKRPDTEFGWIPGIPRYPAIIWRGLSVMFFS